MGQVPLSHDGTVPGREVQPSAHLAILHDKVRIADAVNASAIPLEDAPQGYADFDAGAAVKYVLNSHGYVAA